MHVLFRDMSEMNTLYYGTVVFQNIHNSLLCHSDKRLHYQVFNNGQRNIKIFIHTSLLSIKCFDTCTTSTIFVNNANGESLVGAELFYLLQSRWFTIFSVVVKWDDVFRNNCLFNECHLMF